MMKRILFFILLLITIVGCSADDSDSGSTNEKVDTDANKTKEVEVADASTTQNKDVMQDVYNNRNGLPPEAEQELILNYFETIVDHTGIVSQAMDNVGALASNGVGLGVIQTEVQWYEALQVEFDKVDEILIDLSSMDSNEIPTGYDEIHEKALESFQLASLAGDQILKAVRDHDRDSTDKGILLLDEGAMLINEMNQMLSDKVDSYTNQGS